VALAALLVGLATLLPGTAPAPAGVPRARALVTTWSLSGTFWSTPGSHLVFPLALVGLALVGLVVAVAADRARVTLYGLFTGLVTLALVLAALVDSDGWRDGHLVPGPGAYLALVAALVLVTWPETWRRADARRARRAVGGRYTAEGGWQDPALFWDALRTEQPEGSTD
jgi:hypothetical protein